ncbi:MATE family efflux transporter [Terriglobus albidus]|uniref:MATE family efflux transporter n=1 Tax=Terriglobus albidus TaxID=1592106 RepID=UPI0021DF61BC|nr:MATE family efflux transporter [Terriglobus albidus]
MRSWKQDLWSMVKLATPVVLAELGWMLQGIVDVIMVGRLGPIGIGAVALGNALYYAPSLFGIGLILGLDTMVSQAYGRKDYDACHRWLAQGVYIALLATPPLMLLVWALGQMVGHFGVASALVEPTSHYVSTLVWGTLPLLLYAASRRYLQAVGQSRMVTITFVAANIVNWAGNWVLIYGHFGMPAMGVRGSALSTVLSRVLMAVMLLGFAWKYERRRGHPLFARWAGPHWQQIRHLARIGLPAALQIILEIGAFGFSTVLAGKVSAIALAAHQIALNYAALAYMVPLGISAAASVAVGHAVGAGDPERARSDGWLAMILGVSFMAVVAVVFVALPGPLIALYTTDIAVLREGARLLWLAAAFAVFDGVQTIGTGALRGLGLTRVPMLSNLFGYWAFGLPVGIALCFRKRWGVEGIWIGLTAALIVIASALFFYWRSRSAALVNGEFAAQPATLETH